MEVYMIRVRPRKRVFIWWGGPCSWSTPKGLELGTVFASRKAAEKWAQKNVKAKYIRFEKHNIDENSNHLTIIGE